MQRLFILLTLLSFSTSALSQEAESAEGLMGQTMQDIMVVVGIAGAGAILGLSTLSFVDEPSDHFQNIIIGASLGTIIGVAVVAYTQASASQNRFLDEVDEGGGAFLLQDTGSRRIAWHRFEKKKTYTAPKLSLFTHSFTF